MSLEFGWAVMLPLLVNSPLLAAKPEHSYVLACYLQLADMKHVDPTEPGRLFSDGERSLIIFQFPDPPPFALIDAKAVKVFDPKSMLLGRKIKEYGQSKDGLVFIATGRVGDSVTAGIVTVPSAPLELQIFITRVRKGQELKVHFGKCFLDNTEDKEKAFQFWKNQPETRK